MRIVPFLEIHGKISIQRKGRNVEDRLWGKTLIDNKLQIQYEPKASVYLAWY